MRKASQAAYELLNAMKRNGTIFEEHGVIVGRAADGVVVQLGQDDDDVALYLDHHPHPDQW